MRDPGFTVQPDGLDRVAGAVGRAAEAAGGLSAETGRSSASVAHAGSASLDAALDEFLSAWRTALRAVEGDLRLLHAALRDAAQRYRATDDRVVRPRPGTPE